jgi:hypothetical protein
MIVDIKVTGLDAAVVNTAKAAKRFRDAFEAATFVVAGDVLAALMPGVPRKSGALQESAFVTRTMPAEAGFAAAHAAAVHEVGPHRKYLQRPVTAAEGTVAGRIARLVPGFAEAGTTLATAPAKFSDRADGVTRRASRRRPQVRR